GSRELIQKSGQLFWYPAEVDVSIRPGWFYHPKDDEKIKSLPHLVDIYFNSVGMNAVLLLNVPPDQRGLIHQADVERLKEFKAWIDESFSENLLANAKVDKGEARKLIDNNADTYWEADEIPSSLVFTLDKECIIDIVELQEFISKGQRVESFRVEAMEDGQWKEVASGTTIGYRRLVRTAPVKTRMLRLTITGSRYHALISRFAAYKSKELLSEPVISRNKEGMVSITSEIAFPTLVYTTDGSEPTQESHLYSDPFSFPGKGTVKAKAYINNFSSASSVVSETFDICPARWTVLASEEGHPAFPAAQAIDGDLKTMWHTAWEGELKNQAFSIAVDMGEALSLKGFSYNPRQDGSFSGTVLRYSFLISDDGVKWVPVISNALFDNMVNNPSKREVLFSWPVKARYFKFVSHEGIFNEKWVSVGELGVIT
ncbi:MAG: alpha-L-fucosidase, partial [Bacteroidales bacterium]|nr:alpha-L-fucosidase [Bacteroidales bacterium]